ncbi:hypothetical protein BKK49_11060 [Rodentibacter rarus]|uniref:histidine-type phosphatase n=1 Tax=Rodentibacter rarus TaxID=1908260 RepID=UPI0009845503|nr:histidine-type phosphatase [Rodentibacter rarus]OOF37778.1 hypothetical protein BKK49_11060 [Rodentibacter rarus]
MKKSCLLLLCAMSFLSNYAVSAVYTTPMTDYQLEKIFIFSRHGVRTPIIKSDSQLTQVTPYQWTAWQEAPGELMSKGADLEVKFGRYIRDYLNQQGLTKINQCLPPEQVLIYTNSLQRTLATGQALTLGLFPGCGIQLVNNVALGTMDPVFNPIVRNDSQTFKQEAISRIPLKQTHQKLQTAYQVLGEVIDYAQSPHCQGKTDCAFFSKEGTLKIEKGKEVGVSGSLRLGKTIVDNLLIELYANPLSSKILSRLTSEKWEIINQIKNEYFTVLRGEKFIASHLAQSLATFMQQELNNSQRTMSLLVGHDTNIITLLGALGVKSYRLPNQYESTPIGGKVFFEIWRDKKNNAKWVNTQYVYQSIEQIQQDQALTLTTPPQSVQLHFEQCKENELGFCAYSDIETKLTEIINQSFD